MDQTNTTTVAPPITHNTGGGITAITRPSTLEEIVGLEQVKQTILYTVEGSKLRGEPLPSFTICGNSGCGKSTIARIIAKYTNGEVHKYLGSDIKTINDVYEIAIKAKDGDIVYIEEAHTIGGMGQNSRLIQAVLYEWIEDFNLMGGSAYGVVNVPKVSFVFATTNAGKLLEPLRNRCKRLDVGFYTVDQLKIILTRAAAKLGLDLTTDDAATTLLAQCSRGLPRIAIMSRLDMLLNVMSVDKLGYNLETVRQFLKISGINDWGLEANDIKYCYMVDEKTKGGRPVGKKTILQAMGIDEDLLDSLIEPYLQQIGFITIDTRGRLLTPKAYRALGINGQATPEAIRIRETIIHTDNRTIDLDKLKELVQDEKIRMSGTKGLMGYFNLKYSLERDRDLMKKALHSIGLVSVQRSGIRAI